MNLTRQRVFITNILHCRPPDNREPQKDEIEACMPYLDAQIRIIHPKIICLLGSSAMKALLRAKDGITKMRGKWLEYNGIQTMITYHPAYLLRNEAKKSDVWTDLQEIMKVYYVI
jgi:uracil-DNA glycosylase family 4